MRIGPFELPESWPASYRNARGIGAAVVLLVAILAMLSLRCNPVESRDHVTGLVLAVEAEGLASPGDGRVRSRVLLAVTEPDTAQVRILLPPPVPRPGDFVPLFCEQYRKGNVAYMLDDEQWLVEGPAQARP